jgi:hypothetical protein
MAFKTVSRFKNTYDNRKKTKSFSNKNVESKSVRMDANIKFVEKITVKCRICKNKLLSCEKDRVLSEFGTDATLSNIVNKYRNICACRNCRKNDWKVNFFLKDVDSDFKMEFSC